MLIVSLLVIFRNYFLHLIKNKITNQQENIDSHSAIMAEGGLCFKNAFKKFLNKKDCLKDSQNNEFSCDKKSDSDEKRNLLEHVENSEKLQNCDNLSKVIAESKYLDSEKIEFKQMSSKSEEKQKKSSQDCDNFLTEQINLLKSLCLTQKDTSVRNRNEIKRDIYPTLLESNIQLDDFINDVSETGDKLNFFTNYLDLEVSEVEQFFISSVSGKMLSNDADKPFSLPGNIHNNGAKKHFYDAKICDTSAVQISSHHYEHSQYWNSDDHSEHSHHWNSDDQDEHSQYWNLDDHNEHSQYLKSAAEIEFDTACARVLKKQVHQELEQYRKLFIGNFDEDIDTEELYYYFLKFGEIERTINIRKPKTRSKYIGYIIIFNNSDSVTAALLSEPHVVCDRTLKLNLPKNDGSDPEEFCKLFVGNLNSGTSENDLWNHFRRWGTITKCVIKRKPEARISKCYGFVTFKFFSAMNDALVFPYHRIRGRNLKVDLSQERDEAWGFHRFKDECSTKIDFRMAKRSKKVDRKSSYSNKNRNKKGFLTERQMLEIIEKSKTFKPHVLNYELNDFDGAGVNIFKHTPLSQLKSDNLSYVMSSLDSAQPPEINYHLNDFDGDGVHTPLSQLKSDNLNYVMSSLDSAQPPEINYNLNDFDGAGVNIFKKSSHPKLYSKHLSYNSLSSDSEN